MQQFFSPARSEAGIKKSVCSEMTLNRTHHLLPTGITPPSYDIGSVTPGIVHIGLGGFHRAHFARYTHDLMGIDPAGLNWGIIGAGLRPSDSSLLSALDRQDGLYTLVERDGRSETRTLIGSVIGVIDATRQSFALIEAIVRRSTRIVSITVSENGYHLDGITRSLNHADPAIQQDIGTPREPRTLPGILVEAFRRRRDAQLPVFTALSCDNIKHNGQVLRAAVLALARFSDPGLADWIEEHGRFPSCMVDRITPVPTQEQIDEFRNETGLDDHVPIFCESFRQWVIEDAFADGRPDWDRVGAQFVEDVAPYESMKLRLLNASHLAIAGLGSLCGYQTVIETIGDPLIRRYMVRLMDAETGPTLPPVPGIDLAAYKATLLERFANPAIRDTVQRINADAPVNLLLDPLRDRLAIDAPVNLLALGLAAWCRRVQIEARLPVEGRAMGRAEALLQERARTETDPVCFLRVEAIFGEIGKDPRLVSMVRYWLKSLEKDDAVAALKRAAAAGFF
jgi:mannitol 2-dehydrogenase